MDVSSAEVGDVLDLTPREAAVLIAEQWAYPDRRLVPATPHYVEGRTTPDADGYREGAHFRLVTDRTFPCG